MLCAGYRLKIPVVLKSYSEAPSAKEAIEMLEDSPRLDVGDAGLELGVQGDGALLQICLRGRHGTLIGCAQPQGKPEDLAKMGPAELASAAVEAFHRRALAMPLGLTGTDMNSLDGSTTVAEQAVREQVHGLLDNIVGDSFPE